MNKGAFPRERVAELYGRYRQPRSLEEDIRLHELSGYVIETADAFLMGRGVDKDQDEEVIRAPHVIFPRSRQNAWFIWIYVGPIEEMLSLAPYYLPWVGWSRRNGRIRWYSVETALGKVAGLSRTANYSA